MCGAPPRRNTRSSRSPCRAPRWGTGHEPPRRACSMTAPLRLRIDTLVLPAMSAERGERVGAALRTELARLLADEGAQARLRAAGSHPALQAPALRASPRERP